MTKTRLYCVALGFCPLFLMQLNTGCPVTPGTGTSTVGGQIFNLPPTPIISADVVRGVAPLTVQFSSSNSTDDGLIVARRWDFDNGQTSPDISPQITFDQVGSYDVALTITDDAAASSIRTLQIVVTLAPIPVITVDRTAAESAPAIINFDASQSRDPDGAIVSYRWDFGDGSREVLPVVPHTFATSGTFRVRLTVTDVAGVTATVDQLISIGIPRPQISFRQPPNDVTNLVLSQDSPLWVTAVFDVTPTTPRTLKAGLDSDRDPCDAVAVLYDALSGAESTRLGNLSDAVNAVAFSPDGQFLAVGTADGTLAIFNAGTERPLNRFTSESGAVTSIAFSANASRIAVGYDTGVVHLRLRSSGQIVIELDDQGAAVNAVAFSADGTRVAAARDNNSATVWNANSGATIATLNGHTGPVNAIAFNPVNADQIVTGSSDNNARLWNAATGQALGVFRPTLLFGHNAPVNAVAFSPNGTQVVTGSDDRTVIIWDVATFTAVRTLTGHAEAVLTVGFSPDGGQVVSGGSDRTVRVSNVATGSLVRSLQPCRSPISSAAFAPSGTRLLVGVQSRNGVQLDASPANGNDLNLTVPTPLVLSNVPPGAYSLWVEIDTDRTAPVRAYSGTTINVVEPYTPEVTAFTPRIPLVNDRASIVVESVFTRQIFDLGPLSEGDRIDVRLLSVPGYRPNFDQDQYSVMLFDASLELFAWFQKQAFVPTSTLFSPDIRLVAARNTASLYVVVDTGSSIDVRIQRAFGLTKRAQRIFLDFRGGADIRVSRAGPFTFGPLRAPDLDDNFTDAETTQLRSQITETVRSYYAPWNVDVVSSDEGSPPSQPFQTIYFGAFAPFLFGIADYIDPRNATLAGSAIVLTDSIAAAFPDATLDFFGSFLGLVATHEAGHVLGLRHVANSEDIMNSGGPDLNADAQFRNSPIQPLEIPNGAIGTQNEPQLLEDIIGLRAAATALHQTQWIQQALRSYCCPPAEGAAPPGYRFCGSE